MESVFKNEYVLDPEYLPEVLPFRENQIRVIANNLLPLKYGKKARNMLIYGLPGIGKTASVKFVFNNLKEEGIKTAYINCWVHRTPVSILAEITLSLGFFVARRGWGKDEIMHRLVEAINKSDGIAICLDEVDKANSEVFYDLLRINQFVDKPVGYVFITNTLDFLARVDARIRSSFLVEDIEFKPYKLHEMEEILRQRAELAFYDYEHEVVKLAASIAIKKNSDVRVGLDLLRRAGLKAWDANRVKVKLEDLRKVIGKVDNPKKKIVKEKNLNEKERMVLNSLSYKYENALEVYKNSMVKDVMGKRNFYKYIDRLVNLGLVKKKKQGNKVFVKKI